MDVPQATPMDPAVRAIEHEVATIQGFLDGARTLREQADQAECSALRLGNELGAKIAAGATTRNRFRDVLLTSHGVLDTKEEERLRALDNALAGNATQLVLLHFQTGKGTRFVCGLLTAGTLVIETNKRYCSPKLPTLAFLKEHENRKGKVLEYEGQIELPYRTTCSDTQDARDPTDPPAAILVAGNKKVRKWFVDNRSLQLYDYCRKKLRKKIRAVLA